MTPQNPRRPDRERDDEPETSSFPPVGNGPASTPYQPQYVPGRQRPRQSRRSGLAAGLLVVLIIGAVALGVGIYNAFLSGDADGGEEEPPAAAPTTTTTLTAPPVSPAPAPPETTPEETTPETTESPETTSRPQFRAPSGAEQCAANVNWRIFRATDVTTCGFAENVAIEMAGNTGQATAHDVRVSSPATGQTYTMRCAPEDGNSFTCRGGDNAVVVLEDRAVRD